MSATLLEMQDTEFGGKYLTFFMDEEEFGIQILTVREIIGMMPVTVVPRTPGHVRGVINLRGKVIPVVELRRRFGMESVKDTEETCIIVVDAGGIMMGVVVDRVSEVLDIDSGDIVDAPDLGQEVDTDYILGIGKAEGRVTLLLDFDRIFTATQLSGLAETAPAVR